MRSRQGRPIGQVVNDVQRAGPGDVFVQADGEHVTSVRRSDAAHQARLRSGVIRPATDEEFQQLKGFIA